MKIYLAGKITKNGWRNTIFDPSLHADTIYDPASVTSINMRKVANWPVFCDVLTGGNDYVGPYFMADDHGCGHGNNSHGVGAGGYDITCLGDCNPSQKQTVDLCRKAIIACDLVFAWIDAEDCYGTIAELGYAKALNKTIHIAGSEKFEDLWFVYGLCSSGKVDFGHDNAKAAFDWYINIGSLKTMPYQNYLKTEHWLNFRKGALERASYKCQVCNSGSQLQVHHRTYRRRGEELPEDVIVLCDSCHDIFHQNGKLAS